MARECEYRRPGDGAPCVMGAMHLTNHYFAEAEPARDEVLEAVAAVAPAPPGEINASDNQDTAPGTGDNAPPEG